MVANMLDGIEVRLNTDYLENKDELDKLAEKVVYTGAIDAYFDYKLGALEYRSVRFDTEVLDTPNFREMLRSTIRIVKPRGPELLSTSGLSLVRMMKEMTFLRLSSAGNTVPNGK